MQLEFLAGILTLALIAMATMGRWRQWLAITLSLPAGCRVRQPYRTHPNRLPPVTIDSAAIYSMEGQGSSIPVSLGRYEIIEQVGKGAMGVVYKGRDPRLDRLTAIKTIRIPDSFDDAQMDSALRQLGQEAELLAGLTHPNIVTVYDVGEDRGTLFVAMEFLDGERLSAFTRAEQLLPINKVLDIVGQVADALAFAHENGIVHRDIKPDNIVVQDDGSVKVTDFGIALTNIGERTHTTPLKGSVHYMSPEQVKGERITGQSDVFALGVVLFELLSGSVPFSGDSDASIVYQITSAPAPKISERRPELSLTLGAIVDRALAKDPADRYPDAEAMVGDLIAEMGTELDQNGMAEPGDATDPDDLFDDADFALPVMVPAGDISAEDVPGAQKPTDADLDFSDIEDLFRSDPKTTAVENAAEDDLFSDAADSVPVFDTGAFSEDAPRDLFDTVPEEVISAPPPAPTSKKEGMGAWADRWRHMTQHRGMLSKGSGGKQFEFVRVLAACLLITGIGLAWYAYMSSKIDDPYWSGDGASLSQYRKPAASPPTAAAPVAHSVKPGQPKPDAPVQSQSQPAARVPVTVPPPSKPETPSLPSPSLSNPPATAVKPVDPVPAPAIAQPPPKPKPRPATNARRQVTEAARAKALQDANLRRRRLALLGRVESHLHAGRDYLAAKSYVEARTEYETALTLSTMPAFSNDPEFFALSAEINAMLARDDLTYGARGYRLYNGRWMSPQEYENALYADGHILYKDKFIPYGQFSDLIRQLSHNGARRYLTRKFINRQAHKTLLTFQGMRLITTDRRGARIAVQYTWEVWTFQAIETGECDVTVEYDAISDQWRNVDVTMPGA